MNDLLIKWLQEPQEAWKGRTPLEELERGNTEGVMSLILRIADPLFNGLLVLEEE